MVPSEGFEPPTGGLEVQDPAFISVQYSPFCPVFMRYTIHFSSVQIV